jgi:rod shape-determining protein MreB
MFNLSKDLGIDLGTSNVLIYAENRGVILREPSVTAMDKSSAKLLAVGAAARNMLGRTPGGVVAVQPIREGVISDYEMTQKMLNQFLRRISRFTLIKPRVIVCVPSSITEVEERAVIQATMEAGARRVYLMEEPLAAALGAGINFSGADGHMIVDIGGGTTDVAVLSLNGVVVSDSIKVAGERFDKAIVRYLRRQYGVEIGNTTAEEIKMAIGCVVERSDELMMQVRGRDARTSLPKEVTLHSSEMVEALRSPANQIVGEIITVLEKAPPDLVSDISENGIVLTGGGSLLWGFDALIENRTGIHCQVADEAQSAVAIGCGKALKKISTMQEGTINLARKKLLEEN